MAINRAADANARAQLYLSRGQTGSYINEELIFYPGGGTIPPSFTGNLALGVNTNGPGADLLNGIVPFQAPVEPCDAIVVTSVACEVAVNGGDVLIVTILYNVEEGDIYSLFNTSTGQVLLPESVTPIVDGVQVAFDVTSPPADPGAWSFKVARESNPTVCFFVKSNCYVIQDVVCTLTITDMTGDGVPPNPLIFPGTLDNTVSLTGTGFLSGTLNVSILQVFGGPPGTPLPIDMVTVIDDNNLDIQFDTFGDSDGAYGVVISLDEDPMCEAMIGFEILEPQIFIAAA